MKRIVTYIAAGLLVISAQSLLAQSTATNSVPGTPGTHQGDRRERMEHLLKALDLTHADLKGLTPEERQTKLKERAEKVVADLKAKQTAGTLGAEGQKRLTFVENFLAHAGKHHKAAASTASN